MKTKAREKKTADIHTTDRIFASILQFFSLGILLSFLAIGIFLFKGALPSLQHFGLSFITSSEWDPVAEDYGALAVIFGTLYSSFIALLLAAPISIGIALYLNESLSPRVSSFFGFLIEMLAAIPSVVYGLWGIFVLVPFLRNVVEPFLAKYFGLLPLFSGPPYGIGMLAAGIILAIMITPTVSSICKEVFKSIPRFQREAAIGLGASRWETMYLSVLKNSKTGIYGAIFLGLGRALGETMAVTMVIGNRPEISMSLFAPGQTMASIIANEYVEASSELHFSALIEVGLLLFIITLLVNLIARFIIWKTQRGRHGR